MKKISTWLLILLLARGVQAQLQVVPEHRPQAVFGGMNRNITVQFRNGGGQTLESDLRMVLLQTSTATAARSGEWSWKKLLVLPGQTVLEKATVPCPTVRAETRFLLQWIAGGSNVIGQTEVLVYPTNLLTQLQELAEKADVPTFPLLYLKICGPHGCREIGTFSGQQVRVNGDLCDVLTDMAGKVILAGDHVIWSSQTPATKTGRYQIKARRMEIPS